MCVCVCVYVSACVLWRVCLGGVGGCEYVHRSGCVRACVRCVCMQTDPRPKGRLNAVTSIWARGLRYICACVCGLCVYADRPQTERPLERANPHGM